MLLHVFISLFERLIKFIAKPEYFFCHQNGFNNNNINFKNFHLGAIMAKPYKNLWKKDYVPIGFGEEVKIGN